LDVNGAAHLERAIAQHQHWRLSERVRNGNEPASDPDAADLVEFGGAMRYYEPPRGRPFRKRLSNGGWLHEGRAG
jgi:hypothetical protein